MQQKITAVTYLLPVIDFSFLKFGMTLPFEENLVIEMKRSFKNRISHDECIYHSDFVNSVLEKINLLIAMNK